MKSGNGHRCNWNNNMHILPPDAASMLGRKLAQSGALGGCPVKCLNPMGSVIEPTVLASLVQSRPDAQAAIPSGH
jgi:hypothetical protein